MATYADENDLAAFELTMQSIEAEFFNIGAHLIVDSNTRMIYLHETNLMAEKLRGDVVAGKITWTQAAQQAQETRNLLMEACRVRTTPVGRSMAEHLKLNGKSLTELIALKTQKMYGDATLFKHLYPSQKNAIYASVVSSAGKPNLVVSTTMRRLSYAGKGVIYVGIAVAVYHIATSTDKVAATGTELVITGAGIGGGIAGGAMAGLACGPAAPVCVGIGAFVGGALAAFGVSFLW